MVLQRSGLFGEPDLTDRYVGWIGVTFAGMGLVCAIRQYFAYVLEVDSTGFLLRPPETGQSLEVGTSAIAWLVLADNNSSNLYELSLERSAGNDAIIVEFRSREPFDDIVAAISQVYPGLEVRRKS